MSSDPEGLTPRRPRGRPRVLSRDQVAAAALALVDEHGLRALSMQRVATQLGVPTMTLYGYVSGKEDLLDAVLDTAVSEALPAVPAGPWRDALRTLALQARALLDRHPALLLARLERPVLRPEALRFGEAAVTVLLGAGLDADDAARCFRLLFTYVFGYAALSPHHISAAAADDAARAIQTLPASAYPSLHSIADSFAAATGGNATFEHGLERILDGIDALRP